MRATAGMTRKQCNDFYDIVMSQKDLDLCRVLIKTDLFFLLSRALGRWDVNHDWLFDRIREVEANPNGYLDLWAREHYKSTIITFALTIQDILCDPELTIAIFSLNRPIAKKFLSQVKKEFEDNNLLKACFPDVLYENPTKQAPTWSLDDGLIVKRQSNPRDPTLSAWGLVESMPTGSHFNIRIYDDIIDERNVGNPEMIEKATKAWALSLNLGSANICKRYGIADIERYAGTRYSYNDPYREIIKRGVAKLRLHPGTDTGKMDGKPILWTPEFMLKKWVGMGSYVFSCQILQDPLADAAQNFKLDWLRRYERNQVEGNKYLLCDPAGEKKKDNDYTVMVVICLASDMNYYLVDGIRDRLNLTERTDAMFRLHRKWKPLKTGYEKYGKDSDIEHIKDVQGQQRYRFEIMELGGPTPKNDRIRKLVPSFENHRFYLPWVLPYIDSKGVERDFMIQFLDEEYSEFPFATHDDMFDCMARILHPELKATFPKDTDMTKNDIREMEQRNASPAMRAAQYGR